MTDSLRRLYHRQVTFSRQAKIGFARIGLPANDAPRLAGEVAPMHFLLRFLILWKEWAMDLFNAPPREDLTFARKLGGIALTTCFIFLTSVAAAALLTVVVLLVEDIQWLAVHLWRRIFG